MMGVTYIQIWTMNGSAKATSLYRTTSPLSHRPTPRLATAARSTNAGRKTRCQLGARWYQANSPKITTSESTKSTTGASAAENGAYRRGKYALLSSDALLEML